LVRTWQPTVVAVERLGERQLVADDQTRSGWRIVDPFVAAWLRGD
jgi:hypothetical protein